MKVDGDTYHFETMFHTVKLEVLLHPEMGIVYRVNTSKNLSGMFYKNVDLYLWNI